MRSPTRRRIVGHLRPTAAHRRRDRPSPRSRSACCSASSGSRRRRALRRRTARCASAQSALALAFRRLRAGRRSATCSGSRRLRRRREPRSRSWSPTASSASGALADRLASCSTCACAVERRRGALAADLAEVRAADCAARAPRRTVGRDPARGGVRSRDAGRLLDPTAAHERAAPARARSGACEHRRPHGDRGAARVPATRWSACSRSCRDPAEPYSAHDAEPSSAFAYGRGVIAALLGSC